ncbi:MAG: hypothetical protein ACE5OR_07385 [bacterium]
MIIIDCDSLSSFIKVDRLHLLKEFYKVEKIYTTSAVTDELSRTDLIRKLPDWIEAITYISELEEEEKIGKDFEKLGRGERSCIALARGKEDVLFLVSDNEARKIAERNGIKVVNIPAFLLACKQSGFLDQEEILYIVEELGKRNHYIFRADQRKALLKT